MACLVSGRGDWLKSKSRRMSPKIGSFSRTAGRGSGRAVVLRIEAGAAQKGVLDELVIGVEGEGLMIDYPFSRVGPEGPDRAPRNDATGQDILSDTAGSGAGQALFCLQRQRKKTLVLQTF
jgi:hypothetical protein